MAYQNKYWPESGEGTLSHAINHVGFVCLLFCTMFFAQIRYMEQNSLVIYASPLACYFTSGKVSRIITVLSISRLASNIIIDSLSLHEVISYNASSYIRPPRMQHMLLVARWVIFTGGQYPPHSTRQRGQVPKPVPCKVNHNLGSIELIAIIHIQISGTK